MTAREREYRSWEAYLETGSEKRAAFQLGVHVQTVKRHIAMLKAEHRCDTLAQLAVAIERERAA